MPESSIKRKTGKLEASSSYGPPLAVIDVGTTSIRMAIAQVDEGGAIHNLEVPSKPVSLGQDTFRRGAIGRATTEACVDILKSYRRLLEEYAVTDPGRVRAIATSAVREATNRNAFITRVHIATGIRIEPIGEAEVNRLTFLAVQPELRSEPRLEGKTNLIVEVGGGVTELLLVQEGQVVFSHSYRMGSLRLREVMQSYRGPARSMNRILHQQIRRTVDQIKLELPADRCDGLLCLGGEIRFAAARLAPGWKPGVLGKISVAALGKLAEELLSASHDEIVREHRVTYDEAESLGPALLAYVHLARALKIRNVFASHATLRDGLLKEMAVQGSWTDEFKKQIIHSAVDLGRKYAFHEGHARHVAELARTMFRALSEEHQLGERYELLLYIAGLLHEVGLYVSNRSHHKHSMYLILNSELFGLGRRDILLVALLARYHRAAKPKAIHEGYADLDAEGQMVVAKLAAILRVADALERSHEQRIKDIRCSREEGRFVIAVPRVADFASEQLALQEKGSMFEDVYGMQVVLRKRRAKAAQGT